MGCTFSLNANIKQSLSKEGPGRITHVMRVVGGGVVGGFVVATAVLVAKGLVAGCILDCG